MIKRHLQNIAGYNLNAEHATSEQECWARLRHRIIEEAYPISFLGIYLIAIDRSLLFSFLIM